MQRFKNLTKKSGKVASAILSAAMVTSMVLGTNVVEVKAATNNNAGTAVDVQATVNSEVEVAREARDTLKEYVQDFPVNLATQTTEVGFDIAKDAIEKKYTNTSIHTTVNYVGFTVDETPTNEKTGKVTLTFTVTANSHKETGKVEYKVDSFNTRATKMKAAIDKKLADWAPINDTEDNLKTEIVNKVKELDGEVDGNFIKLYNDFNLSGFAASGVEHVDKKDAKKDTDGSFAADIKVDSNVGGREATTSVLKTIDSNQKRVNAAATATKAYLQSNPRRFNKNATTDSAISVVDSYLDKKGYTDADRVIDEADVEVKFNVENVANQTTEGSATIDTFRLKVGTGSEMATADVNATTVTLWSDKAIAQKGLQDLLDIAKKIDKDGTVNGLTTTSATGAEGSYEYLLTKKLNDADEGLVVYLPSSDKFSYNNEVEKFSELYSDANDASTITPLKAKVEFIPEDAAANKDGQPRAIFTVNAGNETATDTYTYTLDSLQTTVDKAGDAVEKALNNMTVTNDTTQADVEAVISDVLKQYAGVEAEVSGFDKHDATADKEGTLAYNVKLTDTANGMTREFSVAKNIVFRSNTFVVENGKKFYYDKNGNLLKNTFLQGTDSPDGYTYYIQNDGSVMQDRLTYHPNGKDVIYFDADGHEVFDAFVNVKKDVQGNAVDYIGYFGTLGGAYVNQTTYGNGVGAYSKDALFYINDYGVLENKGWFQNAAGNIGYAAANGTLTTSQWSLDQFGRKVYFQANGFLAKGLMTDGVKTYQLDETDGHLVGEF